jgi:hypothetical protein
MHPPPARCTSYGLLALKGSPQPDCGDVAAPGLPAPVHLRDPVAVGGTGGFGIVTALGKLALQFGVVPAS